MFQIDEKFYKLIKLFIELKIRVYLFIAKYFFHIFDNKYF